MGIPNVARKQFAESTDDLVDKLAKLTPKVASSYLETPHDSDAVYLILSRCATISDEILNLSKVESLLNLINILWLNRANVLASAQRASLAKLCTLVTNLTQLKFHPQKDRTLKLAVQTMMNFLERAQAEGTLQDVKNDDLHVIKPLIEAIGGV